jgi:hypothetical protein
MIRHISTRRNVNIEGSRVCEYQAIYENGHANLMVIGRASNPPNSDMIGFREFSNAKILTFQDGYMFGLDEVQDGQAFEADLTLRHDPECLGELRILCHLWLEENYELFEEDEFIRENRHRFQELLDAEEIELEHGLTYKVISLPPERQTVEEFAKAFSIEGNPKFRTDLIRKLKEYAIGDYGRGPCDAIEKALAVRLLECLGERNAAEEAKQSLFKKHGRTGMVYYIESKPMKLPKLEPFKKILVEEKQRYF